jgi:hypothetical protein
MAVDCRWYAARAGATLVTARIVVLLTSRSATERRLPILVLVVPEVRIAGVAEYHGYVVEVSAVP